MAYIDHETSVNGYLLSIVGMHFLEGLMEFLKAHACSGKTVGRSLDLDMWNLFWTIGERCRMTLGLPNCHPCWGWGHEPHDEAVRFTSAVVRISIAEFPSCHDRFIWESDGRIQ